MQITLFITEMRLHRGYTQAELARRMGVSGAEVSRWINQKRELELRDLIKFAVALECKPEQLYSYTVR